MKKYEGYALITGGNSGIGLEFANQLAAEGYDLVLVARNQEYLEEAATSIQEKFPVKVVTISQDVSVVGAAEKIFKILQDKKIHIGLLVNNAGFGAFGYFHEIPNEQLLDMVNVMCSSVVDLTYKFLPPMLAKGSGGIIIVSSAAALTINPLFTVYGASKAFSLQLAANLHGEYSKKGIDVMAVCPGVVLTHFQEVARMDTPEVTPIPVEEVAKQSLKALGKKIVLVLPNDISMRVGLLLSNILSYKVIERVSKTFIKKMFHGDV